jgi:uncharacterized protein (DUF2249 family)
MSEQQTSGDVMTIDVRGIPPRERHALIFNTWEALPVDGAFRIVNDHDPKPLYYQFMAEHPGEVGWEYLNDGPEVWQVRISKTAT